MISHSLNTFHYTNVSVIRIFHQDDINNKIFSNMSIETATFIGFILGLVIIALGILAWLDIQYRIRKRKLKKNG